MYEQTLRRLWAQRIPHKNGYFQRKHKIMIVGHITFTYTFTTVFKIRGRRRKLNHDDLQYVSTYIIFIVQKCLNVKLNESRDTN